MIETARLRLCRPTNQDTLMLENLWRDDQVREFLGGVVADDIIQQKLIDLQHHWDLHQFGQWAVFEKSSNKLIGLCGLHHSDDGIEISYIQAHHFPSPGFFDDNLMVTERSSENNYIEFVDNSLIHPTVMECLCSEVITTIKHHFNGLKIFLPNESESHLVHADFDPANILVDKIDDEWTITGVLDWEFAFSGSPLWDVANMLRYSHQMPVMFEVSFTQGLITAFTLPKDWKITIHLLNVMSLLDCLTRCTKEVRPKQCADIIGLITYFNEQLTKAS